VAKVGNSFKLVAGAHRLEAAKLLGWADIPTHVVEPVTDKPELEILLDEIVENIARRELSALDRAAHIAELKRISRELHGETRGRKEKGVNFTPFSIAKDIAAKMQLSEHLINKDAAIYAGLSLPSRKALIGTKFAEKRSHLEGLSVLSTHDQAAVLKLVLGDKPKSNTLKGAIALHLNKVDVKNPDEIAFARFVKLWGGASKKVKRQIASYIAKAGAT
jgi:ParB family chromosome partitioning protein